MQHSIDTVAEPECLILAWQAPDQFGPQNRTRWAVGIVEKSGSDFTFRYFVGEEFLALNGRRSPEELAKFGYRGYPAFRMREREKLFRSGVLEAFLRRLPPRTRPDFSSYLLAFRILPTTTFSDFALLGVTEAKLPSDGFSLVDPLNPSLVRCDLLLEVAGYRHYASKLIQRPTVGEPVIIQEDPDKTYEPHAVAIYASGEKIGNINRLQAPTFVSWLGTRSIRACVERLNGTPAKPRIHIFVQVAPLTGPLVTRSLDPSAIVAHDP